jgi:hypothetical protein
VITYYDNGTLLAFNERCGSAVRVDNYPTTLTPRDSDVSVVIKTSDGIDTTSSYRNVMDFINSRMRFNGGQESKIKEDTLSDFRRWFYVDLPESMCIEECDVYIQKLIDAGIPVSPHWSTCFNGMASAGVFPRQLRFSKVLNFVGVYGDLQQVSAPYECSIEKFIDIANIYK